MNKTFAVFSGPGDIGTGGYANAFQAAQLGDQGINSPYMTQPPAGGAPAPTVNFTINTLHPGDTTTLDAIGQAATQGLALQGNVISPRQETGL